MSTYRHTYMHTYKNMIKYNAMNIDNARGRGEASLSQAMTPRLSSACCSVRPSSWPNPG